MIIGFGRLPAASDAAAVAQLRQELTDAGADAVFVETGLTQPPHDSTPERQALDSALASAGRGDVLLAMTPGHLARSVAELIAISDRLAAQGATLRVLQVSGMQQLDTGSPTGAIMLAALGLLAAFDRPGLSLFQPPGQSHAAFDLALDSFAPRRPRGRPPTASTQAVEIARLRAAGMRATDIADRLKICRASVYRVLNMTHSGPPPNTDAPVPAQLAAPRPQPRPAQATSADYRLTGFPQFSGTR
jgi:DNA invertase Pin-like site-specific DNA recombinase